MTRPKDATGYLLILRKDVPHNWFSYACDIAIVAKDSKLTEPQLKQLLSCFLGDTEYEPVSAIAIPTSTTTPAIKTSVARLKRLGDFTNFKKLSSTLNVVFDKRISLVFGTNGSGKTSICEAVKMLACPDTPESPLNNVYGTLTSKPSFSFRFASNTTDEVWDASKGYGRYSSQIKYFDSVVALKHLGDASKPDAVVELAPFRLEVFDYCRSFVNQLRSTVETLIQEKAKALSLEVSVVSGHFAAFNTETKAPITALEADDFSRLEKLLASHTPPGIDDSHAAEDAEAQLKRLKQATTQDGLRVLKTELNSLRRMQEGLNQFIELCEKVVRTNYRQLVIDLISKRAALRAIAQEILPDGVTASQFTAFLDSTKEIYTFPGKLDDVCPFCRTPFDTRSFELVQKYHTFLENRLQQEIANLTKRVNDAASDLEALRDYRFTIEDEARRSLGNDKSDEVAKLVSQTKAAVPNPLTREEEPLVGSLDLQPDLLSFVGHLGKEIEQRDSAILTAMKSNETQQAELLRLANCCNLHLFRKTVHQNLARLQSLLSKRKLLDTLRELVKVNDFPTILRRMTNAGKEAHAELVVAEFEKMLDKEYKSLAGKGLIEFGIRLVPKAQQQDVAIETNIGSTPIRRVLSEGEQKIHALAMFFCEAKARPCDVFVFDDPSTSFDYNHLAHFVERLRDLAVSCPDSQFLILTHNWDFFVQVQLMFNKARLNNDISVQVLEHCSIVESYSEKVDELKVEIEAMLKLAGDFDMYQRERISGMMRRLVESIVNRHVFNGQRHQFKQRAQSVSVFDECTKLVALLPTEAQKLSDLYSHLSVSEHDDPRNLYISRNKASFQKWYDELSSVEAAIMARRP